MSEALLAFSPGHGQGHSQGTSEPGRSPLSDAEFELLKATLLFTEEDVAWLQAAHEVLHDQVEDVLDVWYGFVAANPHLVRYFAGEDGAPDVSYLKAVRKRFAAWILETTAAGYDRKWLDRQYEIGLRHTRAKKNKTDGVKSPADVVHLRYMIAFIVPLTITMKPFLARKGHSRHEVESMERAWLKAVTLTAALWTQPYVAQADY
jgi:hypothetical protein